MLVALKQRVLVTAHTHSAVDTVLSRYFYYEQHPFDSTPALKQAMHYIWLLNMNFKIIYVRVVISFFVLHFKIITQSSRLNE